MDPFLQPRNDLNDLPKPGEIAIYDYTDAEADCKRQLSKEFNVKAVQWNIERGYKLDEIMELLTKGTTDYRDHGTLQKTERRKRSKCNNSFAYKDFDLMAIQEFDINCARSAYRNTPQELARALKMRCVFLCEFEELYCEKLRNRRSQGGGVHGNGLLTWWEIERVEVIEHVEIFDWEGEGAKLNEPRRGKRSSLACFLRHPLDPSRRVLVYSVHLEVFCGIFGRLRQFSQILAHSRQNLAEHPHQMILGDLNTMAHGLARFVPKYCCDSMRWRSVGWSEAEWWQRNLFDVIVDSKSYMDCNSEDCNSEDCNSEDCNSEDCNSEDCNSEDCNSENCKDSKSHIDSKSYMDCKGFNYFLAAHHHAKKPTGIDHRGTQDTITITTTATTRTSTTSTSTTNTRIFTDTELKSLLNPHFFCPFPLASTKTVQMAGYSGKLDWMLMRGWRVKEFGVDNEGYGRSDHKLLWCEVEGFQVDKDSEGTVCIADIISDPGVLAHAHHLKTISPRPPINSNPPTIFTRNNAILSASAVGAAGIIIYYLLSSNNNK